MLFRSFDDPALSDELAARIDCAKNYCFGRVPFLFYFLHLYVGILGAILLAFLQGYDFTNFQQEQIFRAPPKGLGLEGSYLVWICEVVLLYPLCKWFSDLKRRKESAWLRYL